MIVLFSAEDHLSTQSTLDMRLAANSTGTVWCLPRGPVRHRDREVDQCSMDQLLSGVTQTSHFLFFLSFFLFFLSFFHPVFLSFLCFLQSPLSICLPCSLYLSLCHSFFPSFLPSLSLAPHLQSFIMPLRARGGVGGQRLHTQPLFQLVGVEAVAVREESCLTFAWESFKQTSFHQEHHTTRRCYFMNLYLHMTLMVT